jgi:hypothetical protein
MSNERALLERAAQRVSPPDRVMERLIERRERARRRRQIGTVVLAVLVAVVVVGGALRALRFASSNEVPGNDGPTTIAPPVQDPFLGSWASIDTDGSRQRLRIHRGALPDRYDVRLDDEGASVSCNGEPATVRGTATPQGDGLLVVWSVLKCKDGIRVTDLNGNLFTSDAVGGRITGIGVTWHRTTT